MVRKIRVNASTFRTTKKRWLSVSGSHFGHLSTVLLTEKKKAVNRRVLSKFINASINSPSFNSPIFRAVADTFLCRRRTPYPRTPTNTQSGRKKGRDESCHRCHELPD